MNYILKLILVLGLICVWCNVTYAQKKKLSPHTSTMAMIGNAHIHIDYSSPGVRGRTIFGDLVPFNKLWRAGANDATWIETNRDLEINGQKLPAGKYGIFILPNEEQWTVIFNTKWKQHGADKYNENEDVFRIEVNPTILENLQEHLEYKVIKSDERSGIISLAWEKTKVEVGFILSNK